MAVEEETELPSNPLLAYLESQGSEGVLESSDEFSVNVAQAQKKFGRYSLNRPSAWILKFVQVATELQCEEMHIIAQRDHFCVILPDRGRIQLDNLRDNLSRLTPDTPAEEHLISGILALDALGGELILEHDGRRWRPLKQDEFEPAPARPARLPEGLRCIFKPPRLGFWEALRLRLRRTVSCQDELDTYCYASPVKIHLDGLAQSQGDNSATLVAGTIQGDPAVAVRVSRPLRPKDAVYCAWGSQFPPSVAYAVIAQTMFNSSSDCNLSVDWVRSGVVVKREGLHLKDASQIEARVLVPTTGLTFDLTGFDFKECGSSRYRRRRASYYLEEGLINVRGHLLKEKRWRRFLKRRHPKFQIWAGNGETLAEQVSTMICQLQAD